MRLIQEASDPAASHNCWAWKVSASYRSSDDGEPGGTAGEWWLGWMLGWNGRPLLIPASSKPVATSNDAPAVSLSTKHNRMKVMMAHLNHAPSTTGRPILGAIEGDGLDGVCVLVTR